MSRAQAIDDIFSTATIRIEGLDCPDCAAKLETGVLRMPQVEAAKINFSASKLEVTYCGEVDQVLAGIKRLGYDASVQTRPSTETRKTSFWKTNKYALSTLISGIILLTAFVMQHIGLTTPAHIMYVAAVVSGGYLPARSGLQMLTNAREIDMNTLMIIAVAGAVLINQYEEAGMVVFLFALGNTLQAYTLDKTRRAIASLMELAPPRALVRRNGQEIDLLVEEIELGDIVIVKPGERIPMDGEVVMGVSSVDESALTGESIPVSKQFGDEVFAGTINQRGAIELEVTRLSKDNTIARLISMVEEAQSQSAQSQQFIDRFARYYTPVVIAAAALVAVLPPLLFNQPWYKWIYEALAMLLVACPCALVISTPVSIVSAIGNAAKNGILFKGGVYLEEMARLSAIAFDKTGTLTQGNPVVTDVIPCGDLNCDQIIALAAAIENRSEHPLGQSIVQYARHHKIFPPAVGEFTSHIGKGAQGMVDGKVYYVGSLLFMQENNRPLDQVITTVNRLQDEGKTVMLVSDEEQLLGIIAVADIIRPNSRRAIANLKKAGIKKVVMLTGDNSRTATAMAAKAGIDDFRAELLPQDKVGALKELLNQEGHVAMVGDGVNDAPALATATVGIAMGAAGTDAALETADVALMGDDLSKLPYAINLSRRTVRIMKQNVVVALGIKAAIFLLVIPGMLTMWLAVIGDMGASLLVTLNALRLLKGRSENE
jgi:Cd2+/Zn2+-exporting ATPase